MRLVLLRHAEAFKNLAGYHGGHGTSLTEQGRRAAVELSKNLEEYFGTVERIDFTDNPQCRETAEILASGIGRPIHRVPELDRLYLGVLDGLSNQEAQRLYPDVAMRMTRWHLGLDDISRLQIPGAGDFKDFYRQGLEYLKVLPLEGTILFVGTRSPLVLLYNILKSRTIEPHGRYYELPWDNLEWVEFIKGPIQWEDVRRQRSRWFP